MPDIPQHATRLAVLISGSGRSLLNLADHIDRGELPARIVLVLSSKPDALGLQRARNRNLPTAVVPRKSFDSTDSFSDAVWTHIRNARADLVALAGFLSLIRIPSDYERRVINIHPALLPRHGGKGMYGRYVHEAVLAAGDTESGCTVHFADNQYDKGQIILQRRCPVLPDDTPESLAARVFEQECIAYPRAIRQLIANQAPFPSQREAE